MKQTLISTPETPQEWLEWWAEVATDLMEQIKKEEKDYGSVTTGTLHRHRDAQSQVGYWYLQVGSEKKPRTTLRDKVEVELKRLDDLGADIAAASSRLTLRWVLEEIDEASIA